jgi:hypothetical protein
MAVRGYDFKPVAPDEIPAITTARRPSRYLATLAEFLRSGAAAVQVDTSYTLSPASMASCLRQRAKKHQLSGQVEVLQRGGRVFLLRVTS